MLNFKKLALSAAIASSLVITGCGGGGSSSSTSDGGGSPSATVVSGTAVKGIMKNADVTAFELNNENGVRLDTVFGGATTDANGKYEISLNESYSGGLIEIEITTNAQTRMVCDASACGTKGADIELPENFKLSAIGSAAASGSKVSLPVTAWSTMAAKRARALVSEGKSVVDAAKQAKAEVNQVAGFDVEKTAARDVNNLDGASAEEAQAAVMNAVVAEIIYGGGDVRQNLESFSSALNDGVAGDKNDSFTVSDLAQKTRAVVESTANLSSETKDLLNNQAAQYDSSDSGIDPSYDEELVIDDGASQSDKIAAFQTFVSQARTWATSIEDLDSDALGAAVQVDADTIQAALGDGTLNSLKLSLDIISQSLETIFIDPADMQAALEAGETREFAIMDMAGVEAGTAILTFADENGLLVTLEGAVTGAAATNYLPFDLTLKTGIPISAFDLESGAIKALLSSNVLTLNGTVRDGSGNDLVRLNGVEAKLNLKEAVTAADATGVTGEQVSAQFASASLTGNVELLAATGESFSGDIDAGLTRLTANQVLVDDAPISFKRLRVAGDFVAANGNTFSASASLNINNASSFDTFAWLDYSEEHRNVDSPVDPMLMEPFAVDAPSNAILPWVSINVSSAPGGTRQGDLYISSYVADGEDKSVFRELEPNAVYDMSAVVKMVIASTITAPLTITYIDDADNEQSFELNVDEALQSGLVSISGQLDDPQFRRIRLTVNPSASLLPAGVTGALVSAGLPDSSVDDGNLFISSGAAELQLSFGSESIINDVETAVRSVANVSPAAIVTDFYVDEGGPWGSVNSTRPAELQYYEDCVADPINQLPSLGYAWFDPQYSDGVWECADATLTNEWFAEPLDSAALAEADRILGEAFTARYGDLAQDLTVYGYSLGSDLSNEGYLWAEVEFPNLESADNFIDASFTISAAVEMPELPAATVTATATRSSFLGGKVLANVKWDGGQYSLQVSSDNLDQPSAVAARFFNPQGYELAINVALDEFGEVIDVAGDAFINGEDIGDVELRAGAPVITYPNGEETIFETMF